MANQVFVYGLRCFCNLYVLLLLVFVFLKLAVNSCLVCNNGNSFSLQVLGQHPTQQVGAVSGHLSSLDVTHLRSFDVTHLKSLEVTHLKSPTWGHPFEITHLRLLTQGYSRSFEVIAISTQNICRSLLFMRCVRCVSLTLTFVKFWKNTCYFQANWISCILNWGVRCDVVSDAGQTCCCFLFLLLTFPPPNWRTSLTTKIEVSVRQQI